jgi:hypothetical protein
MLWCYIRSLFLLPVGFGVLLIRWHLVTVCTITCYALHSLSALDAVSALWSTNALDWLYKKYIAIPFIPWSSHNTTALCGFIRHRFEVGFCLVLSPLAARISAFLIQKCKEITAALVSNRDLAVRREVAALRVGRFASLHPKLVPYGCLHISYFWHTLTCMNIVVVVVVILEKWDEGHRLDRSGSR